ncbi:AT-rich interactive domain-containing protein 3A isoform X2 [Xenopus laevis]|uniref:AT-rich interactive domain-containing protein 3 n=1 Tax=Xenopus laevis TaxID=8355 RepID=A0A8J0VP76_XENLA|nr:AT-rich interactive domain-containing protein 3A isoform X2 [Xenopus laevis]
MAETPSVAPKSVLTAFPSSPSLPSLLVSSSSHHGSPFAIARPVPASQTGTSGGVGGSGMRLEAVMENLQRQQTARLAIEEKLRQEKERELRCMVESRIQQQAIAIRQYQAAVRAAAAAAVTTSPSSMNSTNSPSPALSHNRPPIIFPGTQGKRSEEEEQKQKSEGEEEMDYEEEEDLDDEEREEEDEDGETSSSIQQQGSPSKGGLRVGHSQVPNTSNPGQSQALSPGGQTGHHEWTYEEQFKQLYELDEDPKRKEFLDDLFSFMQKRGTPVNRIPIMAKQVLDLYSLYRLVTDKGGLVEVINKKIWREITKGLSLPTSITSAAFTLRTQYMKYLYPYECDKRGLSSPGELQVAIDSNRREGRRQSFGSGLFSYSPAGTPNVLTSPKINMTSLSVSAHNGGHISHLTPIKKEDGVHTPGAPHRLGIPITLPSHHGAAAQAVQVMQAAALEQLREKLESGEPPEKKMALMAEEQQRIMQRAIQQNLLAMAAQLPMNIKINSPDDRQEAQMNVSATSISSINMSIEINGVVYAGVLFARRPVAPAVTNAGASSNQGHSSPTPVLIQPPPSSSQGHTPPGPSP